MNRKEFESKDGAGKSRKLRATTVVDNDMSIEELSDAIKPLPWLMDGFGRIRSFTTIVGNGGTMKSMLTLLMALQHVTGRDLVPWWPCMRTVKGRAIRRNAIVISSDDSFEEMQLRLDALSQVFDVPFEALSRIYILTPRDMEKRGVDITLFKKESTGNPTDRVSTRFSATGATPLARAVITMTKKLDADLVIIDPFSDTHDLNENDSSEMACVWKALRDMTQATDALFVIVQYEGEPAPDEADLRLGLRFVTQAEFYELAPHLAFDAGQLERTRRPIGPMTKPNRLIVVKRGNANYAATGDDQYFLNVEVDIGLKDTNGEPEYIAVIIPAFYEEPEPDPSPSPSSTFAPGLTLSPASTISRRPRTPGIRWASAIGMV